MSATPGGQDEAMRGRAYEDRRRGGDLRRLLVDRGGVLVGRFFRVLGRGWRQWRRRARKNFASAKGGGLGAVMGALAARGGRERRLSVEERLTLGPKQHLYLVRCGEERLLVASAVEGTIEWRAWPGEDGAGLGLPGQAEAYDNTQTAELREESRARRRRLKTRSGAGRNRWSAVRADGMGGRR